MRQRLSFTASALKTAPTLMRHPIGPVSTIAPENEEADGSEEAGEDEPSRRCRSGCCQLLACRRCLRPIRSAPRDRRPVVPPEPEPFDPLPRRSPGMWPEGEGSRTAPRYPRRRRRPCRRPRCPHARGDRTRSASMRPKTFAPGSRKSSFRCTSRMYSKSRRKAPIYWQLATPSGSYSVWLYIHAFTKDTLFRVQNDYAAPKLAQEDAPPRISEKRAWRQRHRRAAQGDGGAGSLRRGVARVPRRD